MAHVSKFRRPTPRQSKNNPPISQNNTNKIASALEIIAWVTYGCGFFAGIIIGNVGKEFSFTIAFIYWVSAFISGTVFLGFVEIINLLQRIVDK